MTLQTDLIK